MGPLECINASLVLSCLLGLCDDAGEINSCVCEPGGRVRERERRRRE